MTSVFQSSDLSKDVMSARTTKNAFVTNPNTGSLSFGKIPANNFGITEGEIYLKLGSIGFGRSREGAFGARHVWEKHKKDLAIPSPEVTAQVVADILQEGVEVIVNFDAKEQHLRPVVLNTTKGRVILEEKAINGVACYTIISAYGNRNAPGTVIGNLEKPTEDENTSVGKLE